jgi:hypothetical protein
VLDHKLLGIYLNDHLAGSTGGVELARRALSENRGTRYAALLEWLVEQISEDRQALIDLMDRFGFHQDPVKQALAWTFEKAGRLKPNGRLTGYSPLSRVVELEGLWMGVEGKRSMWRALLAIPEEDPRLDQAQLSALEARAQVQLRRIDEHRAAAAADAFFRPAPGG